jgi:hypothetical protein
MKEINLVEIIIQQTDILLQNLQLTLNEITDVDKIPELSDMPLWKHLYHLLHSLDQWFINPSIYEEPDFHKDKMNSLLISSEESLSKEELQYYFDNVKKKIDRYLEGLHEEELGGNPHNCNFSKLALILAQYRHLMYHIGVIHSFIRDERGKWPEYIGISPPK